MEADIEEYLTLPDEQILDELGRSLLGDQGLGVGIEDPGRRRRFSRKWLDEMRDEWCDKPRLRDLADHSTGNQALEIATLADVLSNETSKTAAVLASVLIVRTGLRVFCSECWKRDSNN